MRELWPKRVAVLDLAAYFVRKSNFLKPRWELKGFSERGWEICGPQASGYCQPRGAPQRERCKEPKVGREERSRPSAIDCQARKRHIIRYIESQACPLVCLPVGGREAKIRRFAAYHLAGRMMKSRRCERKRGHQHAEGRSAAEGYLNTRSGDSLRGLVLAAHPATETFLRQFLLYRGFHCSGKGREICWEETVSGGGGSV